MVQQVKLLNFYRNQLQTDMVLHATRTYYSTTNSTITCCVSHQHWQLWILCHSRIKKQTFCLQTDLERTRLIKKQKTQHFLLHFDTCSTQEPCLPWNWTRNKVFTSFITSQSQLLSCCVVSNLSRAVTIGPGKNHAGIYLSQTELGQVTRNINPLPLSLLAPFLCY